MKRRGLVVYLIAALLLFTACASETESISVSTEPHVDIERVNPEVVTTKEMLLAASPYCLLYSENGKYGIMSSSGESIEAPLFTDYKLFLQDNTFALYETTQEGTVSSLYDATGRLLWTNSGDYADCLIYGFSDNYLVVVNESRNIWYYLDARKGFLCTASINASKYGKERLSLSNKGIVTGVSNGNLGYFYYIFQDEEFVLGATNEKEYLESRGCPVNANGEMLVSRYLKMDEGYMLSDCGFFNVDTNEYQPINGFSDEFYTLRHIYCYDGLGINEYDCVDGYMLLKQGDTFNLYNYREDKFVTDYGLEEVYMGPMYNIGAVKQDGELKYTFLDPKSQPIGTYYEDLTYFAGGYALGLKEGKAYFIDDKLRNVSDGIEAISVSHRFPDYFIIENSEGYNLMKVN